MPNRALDDRVLSLETPVEKLKTQVGSLEAQIGLLSSEPAAGPTATPAAEQTATPTYQFTTIPSDSVLVVMVAKGNVRAGPSTSHAVIGSVEAGNTSLTDRLAFMPTDGIGSAVWKATSPAGWGPSS